MQKFGLSGVISNFGVFDRFNVEKLINSLLFMIF
jgi:hypothetical protein